MPKVVIEVFVCATYETLLKVLETCHPTFSTISTVNDILVVPVSLY